MPCMTGLSYTDYVKKFLFKTLGISGITVGKSRIRELAANEVRYYGTDGIDIACVSIFPGEGFVNESYGVLDCSKVDSAGCWIGNAGDLVRFIDHIDGLRQPRVLNQQMVHKMLYAKMPFNKSRIRRRAMWDHPQGLDVFVSLDEDGKTIKSFQHNGGAPGAYSLFMRLVKLNVTFAILFSTVPSTSIFEAWAAGNLTNVISNTRSWPSHDLYEE